MKRILSIVLVICLLTSMLAVEAFAADPKSGTCGENLTWTLVGTKLTISGTGPMYDYNPDNLAPWAETGKTVMSVWVEDGVTSIGSYAFSKEKTIGEVYLVTNIYISGSVERIGEYAFSGSDIFSIHFLGAGAPQMTEHSFGQASISSNIYIVGWSEAEKQKLSTFRIREGTIGLEENQSKQLVGLNEEFKPEDFTFNLSYLHGRPYIPHQVEIGPYDNSTYGEKKVTVTVDGFTCEMIYYVTDGSNHLDLIQVKLKELPYYYSSSRHSSFAPVVTMGSQEFRSGTQYKIITNSNPVIGIGQFTIKGTTAITEGYEKTFYYPILKGDLSQLYMNAPSENFTGLPVETDSRLSGSGTYKENTDYRIYYKDNVNVGKATVGFVGIGNCYGIAKENFSIGNSTYNLKLKGNCIGKADEEELSQDIPVYEAIIRPGKLIGRIDSNGYNMAFYALYEIKGEEAVLIHSEETEVGNTERIAFQYDFSSVYEDYIEEGGAVFVLSYSWVNENLDVYAGSTILYVPAKVADATSMTMNQIADDGDFRNEYLYVTGDDGVLGEITWTSSDSSVATVDDGVVTLNKPGTAIISAQYGDLVDNCVVRAEALDLTQGIIYDYSPDTGDARVIYDGRLLTRDVDYLLAVRQTDKGHEITATGCGLFSGQLVKVFEGMDSFADLHTHSFDNCLDSICNGCDWERATSDHIRAQDWSKDSTHHWHVCELCGEKLDYVAHTISPDDPEFCTVCGILYIPEIHTHRVEEISVEPTCTEPGYRKQYCLACGETIAEENFEPLGHDMTAATCTTPAYCQRENCGYREDTTIEHSWVDPCLTTRTCSVCGFTDDNGGHDWYNPAGDARYCYACGVFEGGYLLDLTGIGDVAWIDGVEYPSISQKGNPCVLIPHADAKTLVTYSYANMDQSDPHLQYPTEMKVFKLHVEGDYYKATYIEQFDNLLQYAGSSIRITGTKGIRMITAVDKSKKQALTGEGLAGYTLVEYGTALCWTKDLENNKPMTLGQEYVKYNYAYKKGVADPIFAQTKDLVQYTNVLVGFSLDQCKDDISMRSYMILEDAEGNQITIYGGIVERSIGYIAYQNRNVFQPRTSSYRYVWEIIHKVYGKQYDSEYKN